MRRHIWIGSMGGPRICLSANPSQRCNSCPGSPTDILEALFYLLAELSECHPQSVTNKYRKGVTFP